MRIQSLLEHISSDFNNSYEELSALVFAHRGHILAQTIRNLRSKIHPQHIRMIRNTIKYVTPDQSRLFMPWALWHDTAKNVDFELVTQRKTLDTPKDRLYAIKRFIAEYTLILMRFYINKKPVTENQSKKAFTQIAQQDELNVNYLKKFFERYRVSNWDSKPLMCLGQDLFKDVDFKNKSKDLYVLHNTRNKHTVGIIIKESEAMAKQFYYHAINFNDPNFSLTLKKLLPPMVRMSNFKKNITNLLELQPDDVIKVWSGKENWSTKPIDTNLNFNIDKYKLFIYNMHSYSWVTIKRQLRTISRKAYDIFTQQVSSKVPINIDKNQSEVAPTVWRNVALALFYEILNGRIPFKTSIDRKNVLDLFVARYIKSYLEVIDP